MNSITPTSASDFNQAAYYNIIAKIGISGELTIPKGSVLDFCGGIILPDFQTGTQMAA